MFLKESCQYLNKRKKKIPQDVEHSVEWKISEGNEWYCSRCATRRVTVSGKKKTRRKGDTKLGEIRITYDIAMNPMRLREVTNGIRATEWSAVTRFDAFPRICCLHARLTKPSCSKGGFFFHFATIHLFIKIVSTIRLVIARGFCFWFLTASVSLEIFDSTLISFDKRNWPLILIFHISTLSRDVFQIRRDKVVTRIKIIKLRRFKVLKVW